MTRIKAAFLGYRQKWEIDWLRDRAAANVEVVAVAPDAGDAEVHAACADADAVIVWKIRPTIEQVRNAPKLKLVQALSAGVDYLPVNELAALGIPVANNCGANAVAVAENTVFLIVGTYRQLHVQMNQLYAGTYNDGFFERWENFHELTGKRVGLVGFGPIGSSVARRLIGWDCEVVYFDTAKIDPELEQSCRVIRVDFEELLSTSDVVSLHVPLTNATRGLISDDEFTLMKPTAILVNTTRGPVVDEAALIRALDSKQILGAGLDVTEVEPIAADNPLLHRDNVFLTPHLAGLSIEARQRALEFAISNVNRIAAGEPPLSVFQPD